MMASMSLQVGDSSVCSVMEDFETVGFSLLAKEIGIHCLIRCLIGNASKMLLASCK